MSWVRPRPNPTDPDLIRSDLLIKMTSRRSSLINQVDMWRSKYLDARSKHLEGRLKNTELENEIRILKDRILDLEEDLDQFRTSEATTDQLDEHSQSMQAETRQRPAQQKWVLQMGQARDEGQEPARKKRFVDDEDRSARDEEVVDSYTADATNLAKVQETAFKKSPLPDLGGMTVTAQSLTEVHNPAAITEAQIERSGRAPSGENHLEEDLINETVGKKGNGNDDRTNNDELEDDDVVDKDEGKGKVSVDDDDSGIDSDDSFVRGMRASLKAANESIWAQERKRAAEQAAFRSKPSYKKVLARQNISELFRPRHHHFDRRWMQQPTPATRVKKGNSDVVSEEGPPSLVSSSRNEALGNEKDKKDDKALPLQHLQISSPLSDHKPLRSQTAAIGYTPSDSMSRNALADETVKRALARMWEGTLKQEAADLEASKLQVPSKDEGPNVKSALGPMVNTASDHTVKGRGDKDEQRKDRYTGKWAKWGGDLPPLDADLSGEEGI